MTEVVFCRARLNAAQYEIPHRTYKIIGYLYYSCTQKYKPVRYRFKRHAEITEVVGYGTGGLQKIVPAFGYFFKSIPALRLRVEIQYRTHRNVGPGPTRTTELTERVE